MVDFSTPASYAGSVQENAFPVKPAIALALAALADWLFYGQRIGISAVVFAIALIVRFVARQFRDAESKTQALLAGILVLPGLVPAVEEFNAASLVFMLLALGVGLQLATNRKLERLGERAAALATCI